MVVKNAYLSLHAVNFEIAQCLNPTGDFARNPIILFKSYAFLVMVNTLVCLMHNSERG